MAKEKKENKGNRDSAMDTKTDEKINSCEKDCCKGCGQESDSSDKKNSGAEDKVVEIESLKVQLEEISKKRDEYYNALQRITAEFDNYKKRTVKEKESIYLDAINDVVKSFLPMLDSVDRALEICKSNKEKVCSNESLVEGIELIGKQIDNVLKDIGVEKINSVNETFDPELHNAVMHFEDASLPQSVVAEEFQRGYKYKDKVIRYSMVKVAN